MRRSRKKGLLRKYLLAFVSIILTSFLCLGVVLYFFIYNFSFNEKKNLLSINAKDIATIISESGLEKRGDAYELKSDVILQGMLDTVSKNIDSDIIVASLSDGEILASSNADIKNSKKMIDNNILNAVWNNQKFEATTTLSGIYTSACYTVGSPIFVNDPSIGGPIGVVFAAADASSIAYLRDNLLYLFLLACLFACLLAFFAVWRISYNLVKPLKNMVSITKCFSNGDFSKRVAITTNDEVGDLGIAFNEMAEILDRSENTRKTFIANVSHELKTPMTTISGFVEGILDGTIEGEFQKHYLSIVLGEIKRLARLVKSMLNLSKIDSAEIKLVKSKIDLTSLTENVFATFETLINKKNVTIMGLDACRNISVNADPDMIHQVIYNLVENATKFVNENGYIEVRIFRDHDAAIFSIKNSGEGISDEDLRHIFDRFYKVDKSRSKDKNGMGLGLYLVKKILNLHGGNIEAKSIKEKECIFEFFIPYDD